VKKRISLRWKLILFSGSLAFGTALVLSVLLHLRGQRQVLQQLEKTLETKCDEVITLVSSATGESTLADFFIIETAFRYTPYTYYYQIGDAQGQILARSQTLGDFELPIPDAWNLPGLGHTVDVRTVPHPISPQDEHIRLRSERIELVIAGRERATRLIQTAVSLGPFESAVRANLRDVILFIASGLTAVFFLLWYVTTRSLRPVSAMTRKASQITASNPRERLPIAGSADELDELASVLNDMLDRLGGSLRQMEHFSSDAAHQLRTPLTRIRGELDLILRSDVTAPLRSQLEIIQGEVERLSRVCARLLLLARLDQQTADASLFNDQIDLDEVVSELLEQVAPLAQDRGIELRRSASSTVRVRGSRPLLVEALLNLLDNAIRYTPKGGSVAVSIDAKSDAVRLAVEDSGSGIPPEERERIFQPFYRIPRTSLGVTDEGSGLGLTIVRGIAKAHGGYVEIVPALTAGSIFRLVLPVHPAT